jgi:multicomponent Na+:H+ antiporter subunit D
MALAGIPPLNGFVSKLMVFWSGVEATQYVSLLIIGLASILTVTYVIRSFIKIWFEPNPAVKPKTGDRLLAPALLISLSLVLGIWAEPLVSLAQSVVAWIGNPALYIAAILGGG